MSTRSIITVSDQSDRFHIYRHRQSEPAAVIAQIKAAMTHALPPQRFEAGDYAAALIATMKQGGGDIYLTASHIMPWIDYRYTISGGGGFHLRVTINARGRRKPMFDGTLNEALVEFSE